MASNDEAPSGGRRGMRQAPPRRLVAVVASVCAIVAIAVATPGVRGEGAAEAQPSPGAPVPTRTTPFYLNMDMNSGSGRCQYEFGYPGASDTCSGRYSDNGTMPFRDADGTFHWEAKPSGEVALTFYIPNGVLTGTIPNAGSTDFTVTGGQANWASSMSGNLAFHVTQPWITYKFELSGTLTYTPSYHWQQVDLTMVTGGEPVPDFNPLCPGYSPTAEAFHCLGQRVGPASPPFDNYSLYDFSYGSNSSHPRAAFMVKTSGDTGPALTGTVPAGDIAHAGEFRVDSAVRIPWGPEAMSGTDPTAAPGEQGGPLRMSFDRIDKGYQLALHGWLLIVGIGAPAPMGDGPPADEPATSTTTAAAPTAAPQSALTPRYTG